MKNVKFRALSIKDNKYIAGFNMSGFSNFAGGSLQLQRFGANWNESEFKLEQYIGLTDETGKEVYEGDIIIFDNSKIGGGITKGEIIWNEDLTLCGLGWHLWVIETNIPKCHAGFMGMDWIGKIKIVGNINKSSEG